ncbi:MAG: hypothetical protein FJ077_06910 [Cyanobacteria bacterium K_DeepCast_35m_m2_023]|nr:hypothetical protein [Cyanobacteria bacterium K_DeepCast_35m_m2_023]
MTSHELARELLNGPQGSVESYETISERDALQWILVNDTPENAAAMNELIDEQVEAIDRLASATEL